MDYVLDNTVVSSNIRFQILEYNDEMKKCARVEVRGCRYNSKNNTLSCPFYIKVFEILQAPLFVGSKNDYNKNCDNEIFLSFTKTHIDLHFRSTPFCNTYCVKIVLSLSPQSNLSTAFYSCVYFHVNVPNGKVYFLLTFCYEIIDRMKG